MANITRQELRERYNAMRNKFKASQKNNAAPANDKTFAVTPQNDLTDTQKAQYGKLFASLILKASEMSGVGIDQIQFNFCLQDPNGNPLLSPASGAAIRDCILQHLDAAEMTDTDRKKIETALKQISQTHPDDASNLRSYQQTLTARGNSFAEAANLMLDHAGLDDEPKQQAKDTVTSLKNELDDQLKQATSAEDKQACYDAYMKALSEHLQTELSMSADDVIKNIKEVETIVNINRERRTQITISGTAATHDQILNGGFQVQMDQPLTRFSDMSAAQQKEWRDVYSAYKENGNAADYPPWFADRTHIEKEIWLQKMKDVVENKNTNVDMGPVVKKQGFPGLRNLALSSFATVKVNPAGMVAVTNQSPKSVRSSNLLAQSKDNTRKLSKDQKKLTEQNIQQVAEIYKKNGLEKEWQKGSGFKYQDTQRKPFVLCQTLVRKIGGGDDYVIKHKNAAIKRLNERAGSEKRMFGSNHCIGVPGKISTAFHATMHLAGANTRGMEHITAPVKDFTENAVIHSANMNQYQKQHLRDISNDAINGSYQTKQAISTFAECGLSSEQSKTLDRVLQATAMYQRETNSKFSFKKSHQLHMAALEEVIYQGTGNYVQSSCKSGKDREGALKNYRNAMLAFYTEFGRLPPSTTSKEVQPGDRQAFIKIFIELFKTNHQARLAELNAAGCEGQKALSNILPKDIYRELTSDAAGKALLKNHKQNAALNDIGHSAVKADPKKVEEYSEPFSQKIAESRQQEHRHSHTA